MYFLFWKIVQLNEERKIINWVFSPINGFDSTKTSLSGRGKQKPSLSHGTALTLKRKGHTLKLIITIFFYKW